MNIGCDDRSGGEPPDGGHSIGDTSLLCEVGMPALDKKFALDKEKAR